MDSSLDPAAPMNEIPKVVFTHSGVESAATTASLENAREMRGRSQGRELQPGAESWQT